MTLQLMHEAFNRAKSDVRNASDRLRTDRNTVDTKVSGFLESGWTGVAADSFVTAFDEWKTAATDVLDGLVAMGELLDAVHADFIAQDEGSQQRLDSISARIIERLG